MTRKQRKMLWRIATAAVLMVILQFLPVTGWLRFGLHLIPYLVIGYDVLLKAGMGIWDRQVFDENFLMAIATVGAMVLGVTQSGDYVEAVAVMLFYQIGELFQSYAIGKSRKSISALMDIRPDYANLEVDGELVRVDPEEVAVGSIIVVHPGEKIPIDGVVVEGNSDIDTSALTGESIPREVFPGSEILNGCVCLNGAMRIRTSREFGESTVAKILDLVENASSNKSRSENFISRFARIYTPAVCYSAFALAVLPPLLGLGNWTSWLYRALTFLVASCPCALVISIPLTFFAGIGGASRAGVLVKGSNYLEALAKTKTVAFDKTGTLTQGNFQVQNIVSVGPKREEMLDYAAHVESASNHPISKSLRKAYNAEIRRDRVSQMREYSGCGVTALVDGIPVAVGNQKLMTQLGLSGDICEELGTVVHIAIGGKYAGYIRIADEAKPTAKAAIGALKAVGVKECVMLTGDSHAAASQVAEALGIAKVYSQLLPGQKVEMVERMLADRRKDEMLAFVGDGINDAPVLARADIGIAMGAMGSDAAMEAADVVLMDDDPMKIAKAIRISRKCMTIVYQNIVFAIAVKLLSLVLVAAGAAGMWLAIFADVGVMVLAVLNAIRALYHK